MSTGYVVGVFDLFHSGHGHLINRSLKLCNKLIVGVHTDEFVESYKRKPKQSVDERVSAIQKLYPNLTVEKVGGSHIDLVKRHKITHIYHGDDWPEEPYKEQIGYYTDGLDTLNVKVVLLPYTRGISTTKIISNECQGKKFSHYIFDLDRTLLLNNVAMPYAVQLIKKLQKLNKKISVVTNNNRFTPEDIALKLQKEGMQIPEESIFSSLRAVKECVKNFKKVFVWGTNDAKEWLKKEGVNVTDDECDVVVVLFKNDWSYTNLVHLCKRVKNASTYIAGNIDFTYPNKTYILPDTGSITKLIECSTNKQPDIICGKSRGNIIDKNMLTDAVMIGDSLNTDAVFAYQNKITFLHVSDVDERARYTHLGVVLDLHV